MGSRSITVDFSQELDPAIRSPTVPGDVPPSSAPGGASAGSSRLGGNAAKREQVAAACEQCRAAKSKCNAVRPSCQRCSSRGVVCYYEVEPDTTRSMALKRKHESLKVELDRMMELYGHLRTRPEVEAAEILRQIRTTSDAFAVLRFIQQGDVLLQRDVNSRRHDARMRNIDADALQSSRIKVHARPWTTVAGDGIVSHLLTILFDREQPFILPFLDEASILTDMASQDISTAKYCSPMLVNAMCAFAAFTSLYAEAIDSANKVKMRQQFFNEARKLYDNSRGKASVTTAQSLLILYLFSNGGGMDRAGLVFRMSAAEMYKRLRLGLQLPSSRVWPAPQHVHQRTLSRNAWGCFALESLIAFAYLQPSLIAVPTLPRHFVETTRRLSCDWTRLLGSEDILNAQSDISIILYRITTYRPNVAGEEDDITARCELYNSLSKWKETLPTKWSFRPAQVQQYHYLRAYYHFASIVLWRPLINLNAQLPYEGGSTSALLLNHSTKILFELDECKRSFPIDFVRGSNSTMFFFYVAGFLLVFLMPKYPDATREPFTYVCQFLSDTSRFWPACTAMFKGLLAVAQQLGAGLPEEVKMLSARLDEIGIPIEASAASGVDVPISWTLPQHTVFLELLSNDGADIEEAGIELGNLISKWGTMSI